MTALTGKVQDDPKCNYRGRKTSCCQTKIDWTQAVSNTKKGRAVGTRATNTMNARKEGIRDRTGAGKGGKGQKEENMNLLKGVLERENRKTNIHTHIP